MIPQWVIEKKRDGGTLDEAEIRAFIAGFTDGAIPDYQMAALAMAIYFRGMTSEETAILTDAMMRSGDLVTFEAWPRPTADKHSTGGIGDKLSLMIAPLAASAGLAVPMISGRGLGITGGTLDKLETIPGYNTHLSVEAFKRVVARVGCSIIGQTDRLAPADKKLYALRDVTGTVPSIPLITASIMSKKLAGGADALVLDVKCGSGAFMKNLEEARALQGLRDPGAVGSIIEQLGLEPYSNRKARTLSMGNSQRLGLARAMLHRPDLLILDEPTMGLSLTETRKTLDFVGNIKKAGKSAIFIDHNIFHVYPVVDRLYVLDRGKVAGVYDKSQITMDQLIERLYHVARTGSMQ